jgi:tetratricopeptide (TPR) repeat protein
MTWERQDRTRDHTVAALDHARRALDLYRAAGHQPGQARALNSVGWCHAQLGNYPEAITACQQALTLFHDLGDADGQAATLDSLGYANNCLGRYRKLSTATSVRPT